MSAALALGTACAAAAPEPAPPARRASTECVERIARALADDAMEGRGVGTAGLERAALYLEDAFQRAGLAAADPPTQQSFAAVTGVALGADNALSWRGEGAADARALEPGRDFTPLGFSSSGEFAGPLVFAGYGIRAEPLGYDDYAGVDVRGSVVLAMRYEPRENDADSPFAGRRASRYSDLRYKALLAREAGAAALILVAPPSEQEEGNDRVPALKSEGPVSRAGLPVLQVTRATARRWLEATGSDVPELRAAIDRDLQPRSLAIPTVQLRGRVDLETTEERLRNIVGVIPGRGALADEAVVVGAHYDHLGFGGYGSVVPAARAIHNGADDNASGVATVLCAVEALRPRLEAQRGERRTLVVLAFAAEEIGLGGSVHYVRNPLFPIERTVAMVNLDMVGRLRDRKLVAMGSDSAEEWNAILEPRARALELTLTTGGDGYGPSDQMAFYEKGVPVIHLFTGAHSEYHTPDDDFATLNVEGMAHVADFVAAVLLELVTEPQRLSYRAARDVPAISGDSRGYGAYLGTIPDFSQMGQAEGGVRLSDVRAGGPADRAGLRGGDVIVEMAGVEIQNLYDMTFVLRDHKPGQTIEIVVLRDGERVSMLATLGDRARDRDPDAPPRAAAPASDWAPSAGTDATARLDPREVHLADLRQLTFDGENAEAYFSPDGRTLVFQRTPPDGGCDQQYLLDLTSGEVTRLSSGRGRTTCGYYAYPNGERLIYATTEHVDAACPAPPDRSQGYVWPLYDFDLVWQAGPGAPTQPFVSEPGAYDAEATVCMRDGRVVFTSTRDGDLDLYAVNADGSDLRRLTDTPGYDGGAFFTPDCTGIVFRASRPTGPRLDDYRALLAQGLVRPDALEIFFMDADGGNLRPLTDNGKANFAPYPLPDGRGVLFSSNLGGSAREFDLYRVGLEGGEPERITFTPEFDGFPMFSPDGRWLVFASNRAGGRGQTNLFIARWVESPEAEPAE
ncbi:MAG: M28 family peptidase [Deltaproteobacteria bacterium]|nr:MAG: M28 family peptidase [Deltaproteobacteria bacterium]